MSDPIPVRYWPDPHTMLLGYLDVGEAQAAGDTVSYSMTFRAAPLFGDKPRYDVRITPDGGMSAPTPIPLPENGEPR